MYCFPIFDIRESQSLWCFHPFGRSSECCVEEFKMVAYIFTTKHLFYIHPEALKDLDPISIESRQLHRSSLASRLLP